MGSGYRFSADASEIDRELVHRWISEQSYWAPERSRAKQDAAIDGSRNFGVYDTSTQRQVAYARAVTDGATFVWLCDVFVDPEVRGHGIARMLISGVIDEFRPLGLRRIALATNDAHGLYAKFGFGALAFPETWMELVGDPTA
ncbi:GNAT family N-acetyltransferase [Leifsonia sp. NPDC056824]|uniref:GNAT family N-acetyltransferase n=1 Tax=Leifsonia sp. NPDC056824 TaxID=3345953 RepID=UPI00369BCAAB